MIVVLFWTVVLGENPTMVHLEFKETMANLPGRLGSIYYQQFYLSGDQLRIDYGTESSRIIQLRDGLEVALDHINKTYSQGAVTPDDDTQAMMFQRFEPFQQTWQELPCEVYFYRQTEGDAPFQVELWFSDVGDGKWDSVLDYALGMAGTSVFADGRPKGFPVRVLIKVELDGQLRESLELALIGDDTTDHDPRLFAIPAEYTPQPSP
ncbi:MAG: hypothetical protein KDC35_06470 [Acidobacteria bacterium]|nr:hypothetical protein [Acidobacteriota bacterium]